MKLWALSLVSVVLTQTEYLLFRIKRFVLNEKLPQNASKLAILLEYENSHSFFRFSLRATLFFPNECPGLCRQVWQILKRFAGAFHQAQTSYF